VRQHPDRYAKGATELLRRDDSSFRGLSVREQERGCQYDGVHFVDGDSGRDGVFVHTASKAYVGLDAQDGCDGQFVTRCAICGM
jgi:hypothetical protein